MLKKISTYLCLLMTTTFFAQVGGEATFQFLNLVSSPRQAALGGKVITNYDYDVTGGLYNPATINAEMDNQLAVNYSSYLGGISYGTAAYAYTWDRHVNTLHVGMTYINYGKFDGLLVMKLHYLLVMPIKYRFQISILVRMLKSLLPN